MAIRKVYFVASLDRIDYQKKILGNLFVLPNGDCYELTGSDELGGIGDFFKKLGSLALPLVGTIAAPFTGGMSLALTSAINAGGAIGAGLLGGAGGSSGASGQAKGLAAIQSAGQQVISTFDALNQKITSDPNFSKSDAYTAADKLVSILSDPAAFYQAQKGKDAEALANFKAQAAQLAAKSKSIADAAEAQRAAQPAQKTGAVQMQPIQTASLVNGISNQTLLFVAVGIAAVFIMKG